MKKSAVLILSLLFIICIPACAESYRDPDCTGYMGKFDVYYYDDYALLSPDPDLKESAFLADLGLFAEVPWTTLGIHAYELSVYKGYVEEGEFLGRIDLYYAHKNYTNRNKGQFRFEQKYTSGLLSLSRHDNSTIAWEEFGLNAEIAAAIRDEQAIRLSQPDRNNCTIELGLDHFVASGTDDLRFNGATADSVLNDGYSTYPVENMFDGDPSTAWAEGFSGTDLGGQLEAEWEVIHGQWWCKGIAFRAGYQKNDQTYNNNSRPKHVNIILEKNQKTYNVELLDYNGWQCVIFDEPFRMEQQFFDIAILMGEDNYHGDRYLDTCITEIDLIVTTDNSGDPSSTVPINPALHMFDTVNFVHGSILVESATVTEESMTFDLLTKNYSHCYLYGTFDGRIADVEETEVCLASYEEDQTDIFCSILEGVYGIPSNESKDSISSALVTLSSQVKQEGKPDPTVEVALTSQYTIKLVSSSGYHYMYVR